MDAADIPSSSIKLIVSDIDGTLLSTSHELPAKTRSAIQNLRKQYPSIPFIIATGKPYNAVTDIRKELNLTSFPSIHLNGCLIYGPNGKIEHEITIKSEDVLKVVELTRNLKKSTYLYVKNDVWEAVKGNDCDIGRKEDRKGKGWLEVMRGFGEDVKQAPDGLLESVKDGTVKVNKIGIMSDEGEIDGKHACDMSALLKNGITSFSIVLRKELLKSFPTLSLTTALSWALELLPREASKPAALRRLLELHDISRDNVMAFGDGENDAGMLSLAGYGVAVGNAMEGAKKAADVVAEETNDQGAVGKVIEGVFGKGKGEETSS